MIKGYDVRISNNTEFAAEDLCQIGNHVAIDSGFYCTTQLKIGDYVHIGPHVAVIGSRAGLLEIEDFCFVSVGTKLVCSSELFHGDGLVGSFIPPKFQDLRKTEPIVFKRFSGAAAGCVILPGVTLAEGSIVGANSLVLEDTKPWTIYAGSPARPISSRPKEKLYEYAKQLGYTYD